MIDASITDNRRAIYWTIQLIGWTIYSGIIALAFLYNRFSWVSYLLFWSINFTIFLVTTHIYRNHYGLKYNYRLGYIPGLVKTSLITLIVSIIISVLVNLVLIKTTGAVSFNYNFIDYFKLSIIFLISYTLWFLLFHSFQYGYVATQSYQEYVLAEALRQRAEAEALKQQLNPHFLFNALNSIKALTRTDADRAHEALNNLSEILRNSLKMSNSQLIPLSQELKLMEDYLSLEKIRFNERLQYSIQIDTDTKSKLIPPLILQTLAENAIKHGISQNKNGGVIHLKILMNNNDLVLEMTNTVGQQSENSLGVGLQNLEKRLQLHFGKDAVFKLSSTHQHTTAYIQIDTSQTRLLEK